jgi:hypothetical protein
VPCAFDWPAVLARHEAAYAGAWDEAEAIVAA